MTVTETLATTDLEFARQLGQQLRVDSIRCSTAAGSGHPTSSMSAADLIAVLITRYLQYDWAKPKDPNNDHLIFSKGHASPLYYAMLKAVGAITDSELMTFRQFGSRLQGHPTPVGVALAGQKLDKLPYHVWVLCGDSELAEGSIWEAFDKSGHYQLANLTAILDINRLGQRGETEYGWNLDVYRRRVESFGCFPIVIDGHDQSAIDRAYGQALSSTGKPTVIIAKTIKGKGFSEIENKDGWHGKVLPPDIAERAIKELGGIRHLKVKTAKPERSPSTPKKIVAEPVVTLPVYKKEDKVATRKAYGDALVALGALPDVVATDGEVSNSTHADEFKNAYPDRFFEMWIAEQQLVATAVGLSVRGYKPFASTFAAFFSRAYDFIRMAGISQANLRLVGSHAGVEIGQDGPSQMALEDLASIRAIHSSTVLYPCDPNQTAKLTRVMADTSGIVYMRTTRGAYPTIYGPNETFKVGGSKVLRQSAKDKVTLIGAGVTLHNCLAAADALAAKKISVRVIDLYSVKPVDVKTLREAARVTKKFVIVEDHYTEGGIGAAVMEALAADGVPHIAHLAVKDLPTSGKPEELMNAAGISAKHIVAVVGYSGSGKSTMVSLIG